MNSREGFFSSRMLYSGLVFVPCRIFFYYGAHDFRKQSTAGILRESLIFFSAAGLARLVRASRIGARLL